MAYGDTRIMASGAGATAAPNFEATLFFGGKRNGASDMGNSEARARARLGQTIAAGVKGGVAGSVDGQGIATGPGCRPVRTA